MHPDHAGRPLARRPRPHVPVVRSLAFAVLALAPFAGCAPDDAGPDARGDDPRAGTGGRESTARLVVTDGAGRTVTLEAPARRIVSMMPSVTEWVIAMDAIDRLVARTDYDDHPAVAELPSLGGGLTPSVEWLAAREPDLVVAWPDAPSRSLVARLDALRIPVYAAPSETIEQGLSTARDLGTLTARDSAAAAAIAEVEAGLDSTAAAVAGRDRPSVLFLIGLDPLMAAGPGTFVDQLLERAGGRNVLSDLGILWPQLSLEEVVRRAPEIIIVAAAGQDQPGATLGGRPGWRDVPAVADGRVHAVDPNLVNRPGPRMDEAAATLARLIHGPIAGLPATRDPRLDDAPDAGDVPDADSGDGAP
ncbi:MAG: ABC transporter substrate-binding protein [Candidatus Longimicrobiales bacterium M2_2A_002]